VITLAGEWLRSVLAWSVIVLLAVPVGGALWLGVAHGESPCILCWAQRTSMVLVALVALFVVRYGPRPRHLGLLILLGAWGTFMALRHSALHLARDVGQGFRGVILGAHTYVWAWIIHWVVLLVAGMLLLLLYAISAAYSTLLAMDLQSRSVTAAYAVPGIAQPVGVTVRGGQLLIAQADGRIAVLERPVPAGANGRP
jgi:hypothetical protein